MGWRLMDVWLSILLHVPRVSHASVSGLRGTLVGAGLQGDVAVAALTDLLLAEVAPAKNIEKFKNSPRKVLNFFNFLKIDVWEMHE